MFNHSDWLGTERARTGINGAVTETCTTLPFGDGQSCSGGETTPHHFTGKERDAETGFDYFGARYYGAAPFGFFFEGCVTTLPAPTRFTLVGHSFIC